MLGSLVQAHHVGIDELAGEPHPDAAPDRYLRFQLRGHRVVENPVQVRQRYVGVDRGNKRPRSSGGPRGIG